SADSRHSSSSWRSRVFSLAPAASNGSNSAASLPAAALSNHSFNTSCGTSACPGFCSRAQWVPAWRYREQPSRACSALPSPTTPSSAYPRSEEHTSELQSRENLVCRLLLEKKKLKHN